MFREMRVKNREINKDEAVEILKSNEYGVLSTMCENEYPYGVPLSYVYFNNAIYFHCALEGLKLDNILKYNKVSFCVVGKTLVIPEKFTTKYESVIIYGTATVVSDNEKHNALLELIKKYSPDFIKEGNAYIPQQIERTKIVKITIDHITGKASR